MTLTPHTIVPSYCKAGPQYPYGRKCYEILNVQTWEVQTNKSGAVQSYITRADAKRAIEALRAA